ncbi:ANTAR domain-containing protein [Thalassotalea sp. 1_MG-2023]|uniref:ANTAR domain-containing response regulator n=1 Tax=Thalassotalea sp. 1_MG-2023 TaxID=3062680 RepID=UPI0026E15292|nr:ANTAR domain-containing protein [Thalassotalea sp. 1_MG-2023]MDO6425811.1 ANTAR domain-containing protein [Thalassotalea sp. 1_MG-2023]
MNLNTQHPQLTLLLIEDNQEQVRSFTHALVHSHYHLCYTAPTNDSLLKNVEAFQPDVVIVSLANSSQCLLEQYRVVMQYMATPIIVFSSLHDNQSINKVIASGVSAYITGRIDFNRVTVILDTAIARFNELQQLKKQLTETKQQLNNQRVIAQAKCWLIEHQKMSEPVAYRYLQKVAMDKGQKLERVAESIMSITGIASHEQN